MGYSREGKGRERHRSLRGEKGREIKAGGKKRSREEDGGGKKGK